jgi:hypothetical protein
MGTIATLQLLYIENHPDHMGFYGSTEELIQWAIRMGVITTEEAASMAHHVTNSACHVSKSA